MPDAQSITRLVRAFVRDRSGGLTVAFGLALGGMAMAAGAAVDYSNASTFRNKLQSIADAAAMAGAREFRLSNASDQVIRDSVANHARASLGDLATSTTIVTTSDSKEKLASVTLSAKISTYIVHIASSKLTAVSASATAKMTGGAPVCVVGLEESEQQTVLLQQSAKLSAPGCAVYSNSKKPNGLVARDSASMVANFICSAGGKEGAGKGSFAPTPRTDCPPLPDPLKSRPLPSPGACTATDLVIKGTTLNLNPGTYCGGLKINDKSIVTMAPGIYIFKNGPLIVRDGASLTGVNVSLYFTGADATLKFAPQTTISLTAPKTSTMAGILIAEDRKNDPDGTYEINSNDARILLGTIYLPKGQLKVGADKPVSDLSAYTIVVARRFVLGAGPTMVLNINYGATDIPVPNGVGPTGSTQLTQ